MFGMLKLILPAVQYHRIEPAVKIPHPTPGCALLSPAKAVYACHHHVASAKNLYDPGCAPTQWTLGNHLKVLATRPYLTVKRAFFATRSIYQTTPMSLRCKNADIARCPRPATNFPVAGGSPTSPHPYECPKGHRLYR